MSPGEERLEQSRRVCKPVEVRQALQEVDVPPFQVNPQRFDPYKVFKFRVKWDGRYVAGISRISGLRRTTAVVEHRDGDDPSTVRRSPGKTSYEPIVLERGVTHDIEFEEWANKVWRLNASLGTEAG